MSEYLQVEKPFLDQLAVLGWEVVDHGQSLPASPDSSFRSDFSEVALKSVFFSAVRFINRDAEEAKKEIMTGVKRFKEAKEKPAF